MDDQDIIALYFARSETAIGETERKYGKYCRSIAWGILRSDADSEECVSDTWLRAWNAMPPQRPARLMAFLGRITRNLALDRLRWEEAQKRPQTALALHELEECVPAPEHTEQMADDLALTQALDRFLASLTRRDRIIFLRRYWYLCSVREIAGELALREGSVKSILSRCRQKLRETLEKEGIML